ncbi:hypothetical protein VE01_03179 [Pseudogymnoascus verrucosus]|uniref:FAD-binding domain-containing protein n=1 Tax=Pseudogymnoascus verrucosus TaxID=342668 RepID=A0A1B8GR55_9PEZI|nr:uncharacterized protein VE01_03179 [Pseudogymnoascus verrucosus]OBT98290.1 hypothetical protein VE01_03179 [Pseudogymnoascus verrucosus]
MEEATILIIGAGPSGLALGTLLARMNLKVVILEKDIEICEDPRGIVINGDAVRISYQIGIGEGLTTRIGKDIGVLHFHSGNFRQRTFMNYDLTIDWAEQGVSNNIAQFQPNFEREIRSVIKDLPCCDLRPGCEVISRDEGKDTTVVEYITQDGSKKSIKTSWLVGADGKRGVVRKKFLEPEGIKQIDRLWTYVGTWVAANLKITTPTPKTHPDFPLWQLGYTPEQVHDIFWPSGFHFCNNPKRPAVSGRFGPAGAQFWRHEFSIEPNDNLDNIEDNFWKQFGTWMIVPGSKFSQKLGDTTIEFPRDCIDLIRCRPFQFASKVVNRWYCRKTMLIGDAAHVFPPFGGQGIATGIRDAQALSWRLAIMSNLQVSRETRERILTGWSQERLHAWDAATLSTKLNGSIVNQRSLIKGLFYRFFMRILWSVPGFAHFRTKAAFRDKLIYNTQSCPGGFFLESAGGGRKVAQIWVRRPGPGHKPTLSDRVFLRNLSHLSILVLVRKPEDIDPAGIEEVLQVSKLSEQVLTMQDITYLYLNSTQQPLYENDEHIYYPCKVDELTVEGITPIRGYHETALQNRLHKSAKYILLRPDFFIHSVTPDLGGLLANLKKVREYFD